MALVLTAFVALSAQTSAEAACAGIAVKGKAATTRGTVLKRHDFAVFLHDHDRPLAGGRTSRSGGYKVKVCRSSALAKYAKRHDGRINLDVVTHPHGRDGNFYMRLASARYSRDKVSVARGFVAARVVDRTLDARGGGSHATGVAATGATVASPALMFVQAVPHMETNYTIKSSTVDSIKAVIGASKGGFSAAGEVAIDSTHGFESAKVLRTTKKRHKIAQLVRPELAITSQYTCYTYNSYFGSYLGSGKCVTESSGKWTGPVRRTKTDFKSCYSEGSNVLQFNNRNQRYVRTTDGVTYSSTVSAGALGSSLKLTAQYGSGTDVQLAFDQGGKKHKFCVGGNERYVTESAELYVQFYKEEDPAPCMPHYPCH